MLDSLIREDRPKCWQNTELQNWHSSVHFEVYKWPELVEFCFFNTHTIVLDLPLTMLSSQLNLDLLPSSERQWKAGDESALQKPTNLSNPSQGDPEQPESIFIQRLANYVHESVDFNEKASSLGNDKSKNSG
jgi:hypothetical protein